MGEWLLGERMIEAILALVVVEAFVVVGWRIWTGRGPAPAAFLATLLSGAFILLAMRDAFSGASLAWIAAWLGAALIAHAADLAGRWNEAPGAATEPHRMRATISLRVPAPRAQKTGSSNA